MFCWALQIVPFTEREQKELLCPKNGNLDNRDVTFSSNVLNSESPGCYLCAQRNSVLCKSGSPGSYFCDQIILFLINGILFLFENNECLNHQDIIFVSKEWKSGSPGCYFCTERMKIRITGMVLLCSKNENPDHRNATLLSNE